MQQGRLCETREHVLPIKRAACKPGLPKSLRCGERLLLLPPAVLAANGNSARLRAGAAFFGPKKTYAMRAEPRAAAMATLAAAAGVRPAADDVGATMRLGSPLRSVRKQPGLLSTPSVLVVSSWS